MEVGQEIRRLREARAWSQAKLAAAADMGVSGVSQIETGIRNPSAVTLGKLARALDVEVADLFPKAAAPRKSGPSEKPNELQRRDETVAAWLHAQPVEVKKSCISLLYRGDIDATEESEELEEYLEDAAALVTTATEAGIPLGDFATFMLEANPEEVADALFGGVAYVERWSIARGFFDALGDLMRRGRLRPGALADRLKIVQLAYAR